MVSFITAVYVKNVVRKLPSVQTEKTTRGNARVDTRLAENEAKAALHLYPSVA